MAKFPDKLAFLLEPSTRLNRRQFTVLYGGRGGLKSYGMADAALIRGVQQFERVLCCRETMNSIRDSTHQLLKQRVYELGLQEHYEVLEHTIRGPLWPGQGRTEFIFAGLKHDVDTIRSLQGVTIAQVEEAASVSDRSWDVLLPTIRWEDPNTGRESEIWIAFNPRFPNDATYKRFVLNPPPYTTVVKTSYRDADSYGFFPETLRTQMNHTRETDPEKYLHIWEGQMLQALSGAIYMSEYRTAFADGRICQIPYNPTLPVDTYWDIGFGDKTAIWFAQKVGQWFHFIDYLEDSRRPLSHYVVEIEHKRYVPGVDYLPHDGVDALLHGKFTQDRSKSPDQILRGYGRRVKIAPKLSVMSGINAVRELFPNCKFDERRCEEGLTALQMYQWGAPAKTGQERSLPLHDSYSHAADALRTAAVSHRTEKAEREPVHRPSRFQYLGTAFGWMR